MLQVTPSGNLRARLVTPPAKARGGRLTATGTPTVTGPAHSQTNEHWLADVVLRQRLADLCGTPVYYA
eukprot:258003-Heterocapsa_arctica.AAC.1